jgi:hypothetical protein
LRDWRHSSTANRAATNGHDHGSLPRHPIVSTLNSGVSDRGGHTFSHRSASSEETFASNGQMMAVLRGWNLNWSDATPGHVRGDHPKESADAGWESHLVGASEISFEGGGAGEGVDGQAEHFSFHYWASPLP